MKKALALLFAALVCLGMFSGCSNDQAVSSGAGTPAEAVKKIGIVQMSDHSSLNAIRNSILAQLKKLGYQEGQNVQIETCSAQDETAALTSILDGFAADQKDVVIAISTPAAVAAHKIADKVPVLFAAVSDPVTAGLTTSLEKPDKNITGTADALQVEKIIDMALTVTPGLQTLGLLYNSTEASSAAAVAKAKAYCTEKGIACVEAGVSASSDVHQAAQALAGRVNAILTPADNTVADAMDDLAQVTRDAKIPCYVGSEAMVQDGGLACIGVSDEELGIETANMADQVLKGTPVSNLPVQVLDNPTTYVNTQTAEKIGVQIPDSILHDDKTVVLPKS